MLALVDAVSPHNHKSLQAVLAL